MVVEDRLLDAPCASGINGPPQLGSIASSGVISSIAMLALNTTALAIGPDNRRSFNRFWKR